MSTLSPLSVEASALPLNIQTKDTINYKSITFAKSEMNGKIY